MNTHDPEELLRDALRAKALDAATDLTVDDIRRDAAAQRRRSLWRTAGGLAAAAAVLVGVPAALYLTSGNDTPSPAPSPSISPTVSPSSTPTGLAAIPQGKDPQVTYLHDGVVHLFGGGTARLPAGAPTDVTEFTPYHGGWLVLDSIGGLEQYDNTGAVVKRSTRQGAVGLALSSDQLRTVYQVDNRIENGIATGMGDTGASMRVPAGSRLVGLVVGDGVVYNSPSGVILSSPFGASRLVPGLSTADATASGADLVGGLAPGQKSGRVVDITGHIQWTLSWKPAAFSPDGRYVAAVFEAAGQTADVAILDARSGHVVSRVSLADRGLVQLGPLVWEESDSAVLFQVQDDTNHAIVRLGADGELTRASDVEPLTRQPFWAFATTP